MIVFDGTLPQETLQKEQEKVTAFLRENAQFERVDVWGKRDLAYEIRRKKQGYYCLFIYGGEKNIVGDLDKLLKLNESVLRYLSTVRRSDSGAAPREPQQKEESPVLETREDE